MLLILSKWMMASQKEEKARDWACPSAQLPNGTAKKYTTATVAGRFRFLP